MCTVHPELPVCCEATFALLWIEQEALVAWLSWLVSTKRKAGVAQLWKVKSKLKVQVPHNAGGLLSCFVAFHFRVINLSIRRVLLFTFLAHFIPFFLGGNARRMLAASSVILSRRDADKLWFPLRKNHALERKSQKTRTCRSMKLATCWLYKECVTRPRFEWTRYNERWRFTLQLSVQVAMRARDVATCACSGRPCPWHSGMSSLPRYERPAASTSLLSGSDTAQTFLRSRLPVRHSPRFWLERAGRCCQCKHVFLSSAVEAWERTTSEARVASTLHLKRSSTNSLNGFHFPDQVSDENWNALCSFHAYICTCSYKYLTHTYVNLSTVGSIGEDADCCVF